MNNDPIVAEVRKARREILESYDWDYRRMLEDAMERQKESGRLVVSRGIKPRKGVAHDVYGAGKSRSDSTPAGEEEE